MEKDQGYRWSVVSGHTLHLASRYANKGQDERKREDIRLHALEVQLGWTHGPASNLPLYSIATLGYLASSLTESYVPTGSPLLKYTTFKFLTKTPSSHLMDAGVAGDVLRYIISLIAPFSCWVAQSPGIAFWVKAL